MARVNTALGGATKINNYDIQCFVKMHDIKKRPEFFYQSAITGAPTQYSQVFVEWLVRQYENDNACFEKCRQKVRQM